MLKFEKKLGCETKILCAVCGKRILGDCCKYSMIGVKNVFYTHGGACAESFENSSLSGNVDFENGKVTPSKFEIWYNKTYNCYRGKNYEAVKQAYFAGANEK